MAANIDAKLVDLMEAAKGRMDIREVLSDIVREFEGSKGLARCMRLDYEACKEGHANRVRLLTGILALMEKVGPQVEEEMESEDVKALAAAHGIDLNELSRSDD